MILNECYFNTPLPGIRLPSSTVLGPISSLEPLLDPKSLQDCVGKFCLVRRVYLYKRHLKIKDVFTS